MPPTVQTGRRDEREKRSRPGEKRSELVCRVKYNNTLPDIPFDPKFITYPFESNRFYTYKPTSLERSFKYDLLTEHDLGVNIDLINPDTYKIDLNADPESEDERLLEEDLNAPGDTKRSRHHNTNVSWLRKTEYISTEYNRFIQKADKSEAKVGFKIKRIMKEEDLYKDRESQINAINNTFEKAKQPIQKHYSKPGVTPVQVMEVFPDFKLWKHPFAQVLFDSDPAPKGYSAPVQMEEMSQAMIRGAVDESGEQFVAYFLPTDETLRKRKRDAENNKEYEEGDIYEYLLAREYNWNVKNKLSKGYEETYFFIMREDGVYYNELETRVRLSKRRKTVANAQLRSRLIVKHRELQEKEIDTQEGRMQMLEPPGEDEEEDAMPSLMPEVTSGEQKEGSDRQSGSEDGNNSEADDKISVTSDRSRSKSRSRSRSVSRSRSRSSSKSGSRSRSVSRSKSRSRSKSDSRSRSASRSPSRSRSRSKSPSEQGSESEAEDKDKGKKDEEEIFGSASSSEDSD
ncbi:RNA polymerase II-associated factor 1 [Biomphalaria pfeifferi]|uniref:RNA polymerase II-associated factor 1 homolog n=1 Tax=Biomphalaria pfeifferi TaxID=112525 RepID=A0AAD8FBL7_BIOPF|nr:RNA polymerase II-associated factor 1 [Biomphalaria pfeifferi]